jgi:hypothetical protein
VIHALRYAGWIALIVTSWPLEDSGLIAEVGPAEDSKQPVSARVLTGSSLGAGILGRPRHPPELQDLAALIQPMLPRSRR